MCIRPGWVFIIRLYDKIAELERAGDNECQVDQELRLDLRWWEEFMEDYNGVSIMWMEQIQETKVVVGVLNGKKSRNTFLQCCLTNNILSGHESM